MIAFALCLVLFLYWSLIGFSLVSSLNSQRNILRNVLLSPVVGAAANVIVVIWANLLGFPVREVGPALTLGLLALTVAILYRRRLIFPASKIAAFAGVLLLAALATGYPLLFYGFDWVSYCNDDMATYVLGAQLLFKQAYFHLPNLGQYVSLHNIDITYWLDPVYSGNRVGVEETLAWTASVTGLTPQQVYMPLIVALQLVLISGSGALVLYHRKRRSQALIVCLWLSLSALIAFGTLYQLLAQVFGLSLVVGACALLLRPFRPGFGQTMGQSLKHLLLIAILCSGLAFVYPESSPFVILSVVTFHFILLIRRRESLRVFAIGSLTVLAASVFMVGVFLPRAVLFILYQMGHGLSGTTAKGILFPYYLVPSGLADLWGFHAIATEMGAPLLTLGIVAGAVLLGVSVWDAVPQAWEGEPGAVVFIVMAVLAARLFVGRGDFGLYKLAMYVQPFLIATAVLAWFRRVSIRFRGSPRRISGYAPKALLALALPIAVGFATQVYYVGASLGNKVGGFVEVPHATGWRLMSHLRDIARSSPGPIIVSDTSNLVLAKFEGMYLHAPMLLYPANDYFTVKPVRSALLGRYYRRVNPKFEQVAAAITADRRQNTRAMFDMHGAVPAKDEFQLNPELSALNTKSFTLIETGGAETVLNRRVTMHDSRILIVERSEGIRNHLVLTSSELGQPYTGRADRASGRVAMYQPERDYFYPGGTMSGLGRVSLLRILNPSNTIRVVVEYTASLNADGDNRIPGASVIGEERVGLPIEGRGSMRVFSPAIRPQVVEGGDYVALDMGDWGKYFPDFRNGVMRLYGRDVPLDSRRVVGFTRDISAVSEEEYACMGRPAFLDQVPANLSNKNLEYSGLYEDGWASEASYVVLQQLEQRSEICVRMTIPSFGRNVAAKKVRILLDGMEVAQSALRVGSNDLNVPVDSRAGRHRIDVMFDDARKLPSPDNRPVSARIEAIGFCKAKGVAQSASKR